MATVREHERNRRHLPGRPIWLRVLVYARPYVGLVVLAMGLTLLVSLLDFGRAYLIKPVLDDVVLPQSTLRGGVPAASWLPDFGLFGEEEEPAQAPEQAAPVEFDEAQRAELEQKIRQNLLNIALAAAVIVVLLPITGFLLEYTTAYALGRMGVDMTRDVCAKVLALPLRFHHMTRRGDVYTRVVSDVGIAHSALELIFSDVAQAVLRITVGVAFLFYVSWQLALTVFVIGPVIFGVINFFGKRIRRTARKRQAQVAEVTQRLIEILSGIKVIKAFRAEAAEDAAYRRETRKLFQRSMKVVKNRLLSRHLIDFLNQFMTVGVLGLGLFVLFRGTWGLTPGDLVVFFLISSQSYRPFKSAREGVGADHGLLRRGRALPRGDGRPGRDPGRARRRGDRPAAPGRGDARRLLRLPGRAGAARRLLRGEGRRGGGGGGPHRRRKDHAHRPAAALL